MTQSATVIYAYTYSCIRWSLEPERACRQSFFGVYGCRISLYSVELLLARRIQKRVTGSFGKWPFRGDMGGYVVLHGWAGLRLYRRCCDSGKCASRHLDARLGIG